MEEQLLRVREKMPILLLDDIPKIRALNTATPMPVAASDRQVPTRQLTIPGLPRRPPVTVRLYGNAEPGASRPAILHTHPGLTFGTMDMDQARCLRYAAELDCVVCSVDYRLAPEHPYPAAIDDCMAALTWLAEQGATIGVDARRIAVAGCSTGATLAAAVALRARDEGGPALIFQMLLQPSLDDHLNTVSMALFHNPGPCEAGRVGSTHTWRYYLGQEPGSPGVETYAAPARAESVAGLPPTYVSTVEYDCLRDEGSNLVRRLMDADVPVEHHHYAGAFHAFDLIVRTATLSRRALAEQCDVLKAALRAEVG